MWVCVCARGATEDHTHTRVTIPTHMHRYKKTGGQQPNAKKSTSRNTSHRLTLFHLFSHPALNAHSHMHTHTHSRWINSSPAPPDLLLYVSEVGCSIHSTKQTCKPAPIHCQTDAHTFSLCHPLNDSIFWLLYDSLCLCPSVCIRVV